uniref:Uncharacterized protein n=1 Tax=Clytia hemisphaerica TaxID=252671 RepID=A0A7M5V810_9CNID|eukprot:TCONS_00059633-protein
MSLMLRSNVLIRAIGLRSYMIAFPQRPSISERYSNLEAIKAAPIPTSSPILAMQQPPNNIVFFQQYDDFHKDEIINKPDGSVIFVTDKLPEKYKKPLLSDEEIEYIMRGGPDM